jgi:hypothetical protein
MSPLLRLLALTTLGLTLAAGCSNDTSGGGPDTTPTTAASPTPPATAPSDPAAATQQVTKNWEAFFAPATPTQERLGYLEDAPKLGAAIDAAAKTQAVSGPQSAKVVSVTFTKPTEATVTYQLLINNQVVLPNATGKAVLVDNVWKVSKVTFCSLVQLGAPGTPIPGC